VWRRLQGLATAHGFAYLALNEEEYGLHTVQRQIRLRIRLLGFIGLVGCHKNLIKLTNPVENFLSPVPHLSLVKFRKRGLHVFVGSDV
jgi:hypothetical protein